MWQLIPEEILKWGICLLLKPCFLPGYPPSSFWPCTPLLVLDWHLSPYCELTYEVSLEECLWTGKSPLPKADLLAIRELQLLWAGRWIVSLHLLLIKVKCHIAASFFHIPDVLSVSYRTKEEEGMKVGCTVVRNIPALAALCPYSSGFLGCPGPCQIGDRYRIGR